jgi:AraC-like DNA-binding protein
MTRGSFTEEPAAALPFRVMDYEAGVRGLHTMRELTSELCELSSPGGAERFSAYTSSLHLGAAILIDARSSELRYDRTAIHIARSTLDHYQINAGLRGESRTRIGSREAVLSTSTLVIHDMTAVTRTVVTPPADEPLAHHLTLVLPRGLLAPLLATPDAIGSHVIDATTAYGRLVRDHLLAVAHGARGLTTGEADAAVRSLAVLIAGAVRVAPGAEPQLARAGALATRLAIRRYLARRGDPAELDVAALCRRFGLSRASLYRLFEPDGGLVRYVRHLQLRRAFATLASRPLRRPSILEVALQHGFGSESGFIRAFRREFGITPGELRAAGGRGRADGGAAGEAPPVGHDALRWLHALDTALA